MHYFLRTPKIGFFRENPSPEIYHSNEQKFSRKKIKEIFSRISKDYPTLFSHNELPTNLLIQVYDQSLIDLPTLDLSEREEAIALSIPTSIKQIFKSLELRVNFKKTIFLSMRSS